MNESDSAKLAYLLTLKDKALALQLKSAILKATMNAITDDILAFNDKYPESKMHEYDWQMKEKIIAEAEVIFANMDRVKADLAKLDVEYETVRQEINTYYGREVLPEIQTSNRFNPPDDDDTTAADWWKNAD